MIVISHDFNLPSYGQIFRIFRIQFDFFYSSVLNAVLCLWRKWRVTTSSGCTSQQVLCLYCPKPRVVLTFLQSTCTVLEEKYLCWFIWIRRTKSFCFDEPYNFQVGANDLVWFQPKKYKMLFLTAVCHVITMSIFYVETLPKKPQANFWIDFYGDSISGLVGYLHRSPGNVTV